ncbi:WYL domain-containing protein [Brevibacillus ginsengisoli]|uniref:WYL domain-containing protein n=1 Tax=Brevibacillus ginsengisoli TaxID=363854 RepID=UPI003CE74149
MRLERYINQAIEIIYLDRHGNISKRTVRPLEVKDNRLKAYCLTSKSPRVFLLENILAVHPVVNHHAI